jgi:glycerol kinase
MQFQSDILNAPITISDIEEASALGAALAGGLGIGIWSSIEEIEKLYKTREKLQPIMAENKRIQLYDGWKNAVEQLMK